MQWIFSSPAYVLLFQFRFACALFSVHMRFVQQLPVLIARKGVETESEKCKEKVEWERERKRATHTHTHGKTENERNPNLNKHTKQIIMLLKRNDQRTQSKFWDFLLYLCKIYICIRPVLPIFLKPTRVFDVTLCVTNVGQCAICRISFVLQPQLKLQTCTIYDIYSCSCPHSEGKKRAKLTTDRTGKTT